MILSTLLASEEGSSVLLSVSLTRDKRSDNHTDTLLCRHNTSPSQEIFLYKNPDLSVLASVKEGYPREANQCLEAQHLVSIQGSQQCGPVIGERLLNQNNLIYILA